MPSKSVYGGRRRRRRMVGRRMSGRGIAGEAGSWLGRKAGDYLGGLFGLGRRRRRRRMTGRALGMPKITPYFKPAMMGMRRRRRRMRGRGVAGEAGSWLGRKAGDYLGSLFGLGRRRRRRRFALGRRPMTYVGSARRSRSRYV